MWVKRFNSDRCCRHGNQTIEVGRHVVVDHRDESEQCSQEIVRCQLPDLPHMSPDTVVEVLANSKCCLHEGRLIKPHETLLDAERCAVIACQEQSESIEILIEGRKRVNSSLMGRAVVSESKPIQISLSKRTPHDTERY